MTDADELRQQISKKQVAIARLEAKAARCNTATDLGRALAARAEASTVLQRKLLARLRERLAGLGGDSLPPSRPSQLPGNGAR
jgi:hypothetical protein